ncbi:hypothetical protein DV515_00003099 [Chloebia gouldiae]|uniref:Uncharacterized protein n=1 Tax=Chloebia gouldiae TaxID=44316 RepID=A0A3L8SU62_CHLGU|nr:hypothetical protein DV515_00003099 [Chloebia gouldiae]
MMCKMLLCTLKLQGPSRQARPMRPEGKGLFEIMKKEPSLEVVCPPRIPQLGKDMRSM